MKKTTIIAALLITALISFVVVVLSVSRGNLSFWNYALAVAACHVLLLVFKFGVHGFIFAFVPLLIMLASVTLALKLKNVASFTIAEISVVLYCFFLGVNFMMLQ